MKKQIKEEFDDGFGNIIGLKERKCKHEWRLVKSVYDFNCFKYIFYCTKCLKMIKKENKDF